MDQENNNDNKPQLTKPKIPKKILFSVIGILILLIIAITVYFTQFYNQAKLNQKTNQTTSNNVTLKPDLNLNTGNKDNRTPAKQTSSYIISEMDGNKITYYKVSGSSQKEKILAIPTKDGGFGGGGTLLPDGKTLIYTNVNGDIVSYNTQSNTSNIIKKAVPYYKGEDLNNIYIYDDILASPDGQKLLVRGSWGGCDNDNVGIMNSNGTDFQELVSCSADSFDWSANSKQFVIAGVHNEYAGGGPTLSIANVDDPKSGKSLFPQKSKDDSGNYKDVFTPKFSPDGQKITFGYHYLNRGADGANWAKADSYRGIYIVNTDGTNFKQVSDNRSFSTNPVWKDTTTLIYGLSDYYVGNHENGIYSINIDGTNNTKIFNDNNNMYQPLSLSQDGQKLVYLAGQVNKDNSRDALSKLYEYDFKTKQAKLLNTAGSASFVGWL